MVLLEAIVGRIGQLVTANNRKVPDSSLAGLRTFAWLTAEFVINL